MSALVQIVALAARTPVGLSAEGSAAAVRARISGIKLHPFLVDDWGGTLRCGLDLKLSTTELGVTRLNALLLSACREVLRKLPSSEQPLSIWLCLPDIRPGFGESDAVRIARELPEQLSSELAGRRLSVQVLNEGHVGPVLALEQASAQIAAGEAGLCLIAGVESYLEADTLSWLARYRRIAQGEIRGGFPPGEGAAVLAVCSEHVRAELGLSSLANIKALASARETANEHSDEGPQGRVLSEVYEQVGAQLGQGRFDDVFIDINDERARSTDYAFALLRSARLFRDGAAYVTCVSSTGELGAASALFNSVLATQAFARGYAHGDHALISSSAWRGLRGAILLERSKEA